MSGRERGLPFAKALLGGQFSKCILLPRTYSQRRTIDKFQPEQSTLPEGAGSHAEKCPNGPQAGSDTTPASASLNRRAASTLPTVSPQGLRRSQEKPKRCHALSSFPEALTPQRYRGPPHSSLLSLPGQGTARSMVLLFPTLSGKEITFPRGHMISTDSLVRFIKSPRLLLIPQVRAGHRTQATNPRTFHKDPFLSRKRVFYFTLENSCSQAPGIR